MFYRRTLAKVSIFLSFACLMGILNGCGQKKTDKPLWTSEDAISYPETFLSDISSDGKYALLSTRHKVRKEREVETFSECLLVNTETLQTESFGSLGYSCYPGRFMGTGSHFSYFVKSKDQDKKGILYVQDMTSGKKIKVKDCDGSSRRYIFSPDGRSFLFIQTETAKSSFREIRGENTQKDRLYLQKINKNFQPINEPQLLLPSDLTLSTLFELESYVWSPDSKKIAFITSTPIWEKGWDMKLSVIDLETKKVDNVMEIESRGLLQDLRFSPNGQFLTFLKRDEEKHEFIKLSTTESSTFIFIVDLKAGQEISIPSEDILSIVGWTEDNKNLIISKESGTTSQVCSLDIKTQELSPLTVPHVSSMHEIILSQNHKYIGFTAENLHHPGEAYVSSVNKFAPKKISSSKKEFDLSSIQAHPLTWKSLDGLDIEGILVYPQNYQKGQKVPLVVSIHGGPAGVQLQEFIGGINWSGIISPAVLASQGYAYLTVNYRGSTGYGEKFKMLNYQDIGGGDFEDVITGVDTLIEQGIADPEQLFIEGYSYGGFMAAWAIGQTHRFKAACMGAGIVDWISDVSTTNQKTVDGRVFGENYWDNYVLWYKASPLSYVENIATPTLIIQGLSDSNVTPSQAYQFHQALQSRKIPNELWLYYKQTHNFDNLLAVKDAMEGTLAWFNRYRKKHNALFIMPILF